MESPSAPLDLAIVGAGISGIGMAARYANEFPDRKFALLEARERIGGTWDLFRYPGVRSDSDMYTLGFGFAPWTQNSAIGSGEAIRDYLADVVERHGLRDRIRTGNRVTRADWDSSARIWNLTVQTAGGETRLAARFLYIGAGYYDYDAAFDAQIPGLAAFSGEVLHPQFWPDDFDADGRRVIVIGSGATAATIVPALAAVGSHVTMLQRSPSWYFAEASRDRLATWLFRLLPDPWAYRLMRERNVRLQDLLYRNSRKDPSGVGEFLEKRIRKALGPAYDASAFSPAYGPWEQRLCFVPDGDLLNAVRDGRARIVTGRIETVTPQGVLLADGSEIEADVIVTATGLSLAPLGKIAVSLDGDPVDFSEHWYYRNCMFSNVPNLAGLFGYLNAAWTLRVDLVSDWLCRLMRQMEVWDADMVVPHLPKDHGLKEADALAGFSSGYLARGRHLIPRSAVSGPWRLSHDYLADRRDYARSAIDDGNLVFARAGQETPSRLAPAPQSV